MSVSLLLLAIASPLIAAKPQENPPPPAVAQLIVKLTGVHNRKGQVLVSLYNRADGFPGAKPLEARQVDLASACVGEPLTLIFKDLKPGTYAVSAFHDANKNGKLDVNFLGIPKEDWGVSNNVRPWRTPRFNEARFDLLPPEQTITIRLAH